MPAPGERGEIWAKMNSLVDAAIIDKLYEASQAGVEIDLVIRGICCLRPGRAGPVGEYPRQVDRRPLPRAQPDLVLRQWRRRCPTARRKVYITSADWMPRNFDRRVEYALPIENDTVHAQILDQVMVANIIDNEQSWRLNPDGSYDAPRAAAGREAVQPPPLFHDQPVAVGPRRRAARRAARSPSKLHHPARP